MPTKTIKKIKIFSRTGQRQGMLLKHICQSQLNIQVSHLSLVKIFIWRRDAQTVKRWCFHLKIDYFIVFWRILISMAFKIAQWVLELWQLFCMTGFCLFVERHQKGSAPAICAVGFFSYIEIIIYVGIFPFFFQLGAIIIQIEDQDYPKQSNALLCICFFLQRFEI